jgi:hypothetical protein
MLSPQNTPAEGQGLHLWILEQSRRLLTTGYSPEKVVELLVEATNQINRTTQDIEEEIRNAVAGAIEFLEAHPDYIDASGNLARRKKWLDPLTWTGLDDSMVRKDRRKIKLEVNEKLKEKAIKLGRRYTLIRKEFNKGFNFIDLYAGVNFKICACKQMNVSRIKELNEWQFNPRSNNWQYIVPNHFKDADARADYNVGQGRLFLVIEFDLDDLDSQWNLLSHLELSSGLHLAMVVFSGGRSLHGWFACFGLSEHKAVSFILKAKKLGADRTTYSPSQYVRMPNGWNYGKQTRQEVLYFDSSKLEIQNDMIRNRML